MFEIALIISDSNMPTYLAISHIEFLSLFLIIFLTLEKFAMLVTVYIIKYPLITDGYNSSKLYSTAADIVDPESYNRICPM